MGKTKSIPQRRFCVDKPILSDKNISYEIYGKLQLDSEFKGKGESRMIKLNSKDKKSFMTEQDISDSTWKRKIAALEKKGLIKKIKTNEYELPEYGKTFFLIPENTIKHLLTVATPDVIKVYAYLGYKNSASSAYAKGKVLFTKAELVEVLGWSNSNRKVTHPKIDSILNFLLDSRLIQIEAINVNGKADGQRFQLNKFELIYRENDVLKKKVGQK